MSRSFSENCCKSIKMDYSFVLEAIQAAGKDGNKFMSTVKRAARLNFLGDIDQATFIGEDSNDVLRLILLMYGKLTPEKETALIQASRLMVNPEAVKMFRKAQDQHDDAVQFMLWTRKGKIARMLAWEHDSGVEFIGNNCNTAHFKAAPIGLGYNYLNILHPNVSPVMKGEFTRLGLVVYAIALELGLTHIPELFVTNAAKDVKALCEIQGIPADTAFLYDDRGVEHIAQTGNTDYAKEHVVTVEPFNFLNLPAKRGRELARILEDHFPMTDLKTKNPRLYEEIKGDPSWTEDKHAIDADGAWTVHRDGQELALGPWRQPRTTNARSMTAPY